MTSPKRSWNSLTDAQKISLLKVFSDVSYWQRDEARPEVAVVEAAKLPEPVAKLILASPREINAAVRGDSIHRMSPAPNGRWALPKYPVAGLSNMNMAYLFSRAHSGGEGGRIIVSGKDIDSYTLALSTEKMADFFFRAEDDIVAWTERFYEKNGYRDWMEFNVTDDEGEIVMISPVFRTFSNAERDAGMSRNVRRSS